MNDEQPDVTPARGSNGIETSFDDRLRAAQEREAARTAPPVSAAADANYRAGSKVLADLIGGITGGLFLGWVIDQLAGTQPWGLLVMMFFGIFIAFRNIVRRSAGNGG